MSNSYNMYFRIVVCSLTVFFACLAIISFKMLFLDSVDFSESNISTEIYHIFACVKAP